MKREYIVYETCYNGREKVYNPIFRDFVGTAKAAFNHCVKTIGIEYAEITSKSGANWYRACGWNPQYKQVVNYEIIG